MLPKGERITSGREIKAVLKKKQFHFSTPLLSLTAADNSKGKPRLAIITSAKLGNAVTRNKVRRKIMAEYSDIRHKINKNLDLVIRPTMISKSYLKEIEATIKQINDK